MTPAAPATGPRAARREASARHRWTPAAGPWVLLSLLLAAPTLLPLGAALGAFARIDGILWSHLIDYVLPQVLPNTLILLAVVSLGVAVLGTALALLVGLFEFPGRRLFSWALLLPLALPGYVVATVFVGSLDYAGPVATWLRERGVLLPELRNLAGAAMVLIAVLYPYVYLVARSSLAAQGARVLEAARVLGHGPGQALFRVALPLVAPAAAAGTVLAAMETLADFGTVAAFNVDTFTSAIYKAWFALFSVDAALQLAGVLLVLVIGLLIVQQRATRARRVAVPGPRAQRIVLHGWRGALASLACACVLLLTFAAPVLQLLLWTLDHLAELDGRLFTAGLRSVQLGLLAAALVTVMALLLAYAQRRAPGAVLVQGAARIATLGYAVPGALLAVGLYVPLAALVADLNARLETRYVLQGGLLLMLSAYAVRFCAVAHAPVSGGLSRIRPSLDEAARLAGHGGLSLLRRVHLPQLWPALAAAAALVLVDVIKEMPITLMTRPFGWDTLSVRVFELTSEGQWQRAALPSLAIAVAGLLPVIWLMRQLDTTTPQRSPDHASEA